MESPYFFLDVLYAHPPPSPSNMCQVREREREKGGGERERERKRIYVLTILVKKVHCNDEVMVPFPALSKTLKIPQIGVKR